MKYNTDGNVAKCKAQLVAKGLQQVVMVNYFDTFNHVVKPTTGRVIFSLSVMNQWKIRQVYVNNAFLNRDLMEEVFMEQPAGFIDVQRLDFVYKLYKSLYSFKKAPRAWYEKLKGCLLQWGFMNSKVDSSLFIKMANSSMIIVLIYFDNIMITRPNIIELESFIAKFSTIFALNDPGTLSYFLGIKVLYDAGCVYLSQRKYIRDLLSKVSCLRVKVLTHLWVQE